MIGQTNGSIIKKYITGREDNKDTKGINKSKKWGRSGDMKYIFLCLILTGFTMSSQNGRPVSP
jgi:hypothetical protein